MKLTRETLKQLIKEELGAIKEMATPHTKNKGIITYNVGPKYENHKIRYYVYPVDVATRDNVEGFQGEGHAGHYKVEKNSNLYQDIANHYVDAAKNDVYVVGLEDREAARLLLANGQIQSDKS